MIRGLLYLLLLLVIVAAVALGMSYRAAVLPVDETGVIALPEASPPADMRVSVMPAGRMGSVEAMAYRGGSFLQERVFGMDPVLIEHPEGDVLIDAGFGRAVSEHVSKSPLMIRLMASYDEETPVADQLAEAGRAPDSLRAVLLTHAHWDHVSGLDDLPGVPVWLPPEEMAFIRSGDPAARLAASLDNVDWQVYEFEEKPYLGFERSLDFYGDGSVVLVHAAGHTPGSVIIFVTPPEGPRYAFVGDLVWLAEAVSLPAERPWVSRRLVDVDGAHVRELVAHLHRLQEAVPDLVVVPAHDRRVAQTLPQFTDREAAAR